MADFVKRRIRDNLHGTIDTNDIEDRVIAHPYFQRLRRIKQTAFLSYAFPGASHTRFEHSLGVMHLAGRAWRKVISNQKRLSEGLHKEPENRKKANLIESFHHLNKIESDQYSYQVLRLAALLHDVGHPPLSHTGESLMPSIKEFTKKAQNLPDYLKSFLSLQKQSLKVSHEIYSIFLIDKLIQDVCQEPFRKGSKKIDPQDIASVINPNIPPKDSSPMKKLKLGKLLNELISGDVDVDRMDYLLRDSKECGVIYGVFDIDRIMDSLCFFYHPKDDNFHLSLKLSGLPAFEDFLRARQSMYLQVYLHKTSVACDAMLRHLFENFKNYHLPCTHEEYTKLDDYTIHGFLREKIDYLASTKTEKEERKETLDDLFLKRVLWKNIYETSFSGELLKTPRELEALTKFLKKEGFNYKIIFHKQRLTSLKSNRKDHFLKLVHKDHKLRYRLSDLKDFFKLSCDEKVRHVVRVYGERKIKKEKLIEILNP